MPSQPFEKSRPPESPEPRDPVTHLYRGAPFVREWSVHQQTITDWTLCGIKQVRREPLRATEDPEAVTCGYCHSLMGSMRRPFRPGKKSPGEEGGAGDAGDAGASGDAGKTPGV